MHIAADWWPAREVASTMTAIAMAESAGDNEAAGDPAAGLLQVYAPYACNGKLSFGLWQIFLGVHHQMIRNMSGVANPCAQAQWLYDVQNNARAASAVLANQGYGAWSTYTAGVYKQFLPEAFMAWDMLHATEPTPTTEPSSSKLVGLIIPQGTMVQLVWETNGHRIETTSPLLERGYFALNPDPEGE